MPRTTRRQQLEIALQHLRQSDAVMRRLIEQVGPFSLKLERDRFALLVRSILSQQISTSVARAIRLRLQQRLQPAGITPDTLGRLSVDELRELGISRQKASYLLDLAEKVRSGQLTLNRLGRLSDEQIIEQLVHVRGIGRWTAQMFLIFSLGRLDVLPLDDLGIRAALRNLYALSELPDRDTCLELATAWRPYASVASWYCWRSLDLQRKPLATATGYPV